MASIASLYRHGQLEKSFSVNSDGLDLIHMESVILDLGLRFSMSPSHKLAEFAASLSLQDSSEEQAIGKETVINMTLTYHLSCDCEL